MKQIIVFLFFLVSLSVFGQEISGQWFGTLVLPGSKMNLVFNISKTEKGFKSTMDSPDEKVLGIPTTATTFENSNLKIIMTNLGIEFEGQLDSNSITGNFKQSGMTFPLVLSKEKTKSAPILRPQEPKKTFDYIAENITFENKKDKIVLAGTFTYPKKGNNFPVIVLISGSGPQNRDSELFGHKLFLVLSDFLTKNGIAVLRYDDRGTAESTGNYSNATTFDFAKDVESAIAYLKTRKEINLNKIGLLGHSEGGTIAPIVAGNSKDIAFIVLMAGTGIRGDKLMLLQKELIEREMGIPENDIKFGQELVGGAYQIVNNSKENEKDLSTKINAYFKDKIKDNDEQVNALTNQISSKWFSDFLKLDPKLALQKTKCPVLVLNGEKDLQVPAKVNTEAIQNILEKSGNKNVTVKIFPNLNHLFQECKTGLLDEYVQIEQTIAPNVMQEILNWLTIQVKK